LQGVGRVQKAGFVDVILGPCGGYSLIKPPEPIDIYDITVLFDDTVSRSHLENLIGKAVLAADGFHRNMEKDAERFFYSRTPVD